MDECLLTDRQIQVMKYRKSGMTQQQIADLTHTTKANVCTIEKSARENIVRAKKTLEIYYALDGRTLCTIPAGTDLFDSVPKIIEEANKAGVNLAVDQMDIINRLRDECPHRIHGRFIKKDIDVFLGESGWLNFV
jgi:HTH-type transcriptional regulator, fmd operon transcriptional regulator